MAGIWVLIFSLILLLAGFLYATRGGKKKIKATIPFEFQTAFRDFAKDLVAPLGIGIEESRIENLELLSEVPFEDGVFRYCSFEFGIIPTEPVETSQGIVLNSQEILEKAGLSGNPILLYFQREDVISEISILQDSRIAEAGYIGYIENRYAHIKNWDMLEDYTFQLEGHKFTLWQNLCESPLPIPMTRVRERTKSPLSYSAQYIDNWGNEELSTQAMVFFEGKKEHIYCMKTANPKVSTVRGICVGCSIEDLKEKYPKFLSYKDMFMDMGPCYGFIPRDQTTCYIAFFTDKKRVTEIWIADAFDERGFEEQNGYVDEDVEWINYDYSEKLTEEYAREIYLGKHKDDFDAWQVFHNFIIHEIGTTEIIDKGLWRSSEGEKVFYVLYRETEASSKIAVEVKMKNITLETTATDAQIWVVTKVRSQQD